MLVYFLLILIVFLDFSLEQLYLLKTNKFFQKKHIQINKFLDFIFKWRVISVLSFIIVFVIRDYTVGLDTYSYKMYYDRLSAGRENLLHPISSSWEVGFTLFNSLFAFLGLDFRWVLFTTISFVMICLVYFINNASSNKKMSMILFIALGIFAQSLNTLRQIIAMAIIMLVIVELNNNKTKYGIIRSVALIFIASLFHVSALCCYLFLIAKYIKPKWYIVICMIALTITGAIFFPNVMKIVEKLTPLDYYSRYFVNNRVLIMSTDIVNILYSLGLILIFIVFFVMKKWLKFTKAQIVQYDFLLLIFLFVPLIRIAGFILNAQALFNRLSMYFFMILILLIPLFVEGLKFNKKIYKIATYMVYVVSFGYMYYLYAIKLSCGVVPYVLGV